MQMMKSVIFLCGLLISVSAQSAEISHGQIRTVAKNLMSMAGFYVECSHRNFIQGDARAVRFVSYSAGKYAELTGDRAALQSWGEQGKKGALITDPTVSGDMQVYAFSKQSCDGVKRHIDATWDAFRENIFRD